MAYKKTELEKTEIATIFNCLKVVAPSLYPSISHDETAKAFVVNNEYCDYLEVIYAILIHKTALTVAGKMGEVKDYKAQNRIINGFMIMMYLSLFAKLTRSALITFISKENAEQISTPWYRYAIEYCAKRINDYEAGL